MGDPRRSIGLTTACKVGTVRFGCFLLPLHNHRGCGLGKKDTARDHHEQRVHQNDSVVFRFLMHWT